MLLSFRNWRAAALEGVVAFLWHFRASWRGAGVVGELKEEWTRWAIAAG